MRRRISLALHKVLMEDGSADFTPKLISDSMFPIRTIVKSSSAQVLTSTFYLSSLGCPYPNPSHALSDE